MKTRQDFIDLHKRNTEWVNRQIRICLMVRRLLKNDKEEEFTRLIRNASENYRPELIPLKIEISKDQEFWNLRFQNSSLGLRSSIFDTKHFISEARKLKIERSEKPWLSVTPASWLE